MPHKIDPVSRTVVDAELADPIEELHVAYEADFDPSDTLRDLLAAALSRRPWCHLLKATVCRTSIMRNL